MNVIKKVHIFRVGDTIDSKEQSHYYSLQDLQQIADSYDRSVHEAPIVWGHDSDKAWGRRLNRESQLANGWIIKLYVIDESLYADIEVDENTYEAIKSKQLKKRSVAFYPPQSSHNPKPGQFYVRHLALLGSEPPAIKGLDDIVIFSESLVYSSSNNDLVDNSMDKNEAIDSLNANASEWLALILKNDGDGFGETIIEFVPKPSQENNWLWDDENEMYKGELKDSEGSMYSFEIKKEGDSWISSVKMNQADAEAITQKAKETGTEMSCGFPNEDENYSELEELRKYKEVADAEMARMREYMQKKEEEEKVAAYSEATQFCNSVYSAGYLTESMIPKSSLIALLLALLENSSMTYSDGESTTTAYNSVKNLIQSLPKQIEFSEAVAGRQVNTPVVKVPSKYGNVSDDSAKEYSLIKAYMEANDITDFREGRRKYYASK